eukprot:385922_1
MHTVIIPESVVDVLSLYSRFHGNGRTIMDDGDNIQNISREIEKLTPNDATNNQYTYISAKNNQTYDIVRRSQDFGVQINTQTNVCRQVRRIKSDEGGGNIYPYFWDLDEIKKYDETEVVDVNLTHPAAEEVIKSFTKTVFHKKVVKLEAIMNQYLFDRYTYQRDMMLKLKNGDEIKLNERELFHGSKDHAIDDMIKKQGFRKQGFGKYLMPFGEGTYFGRDASYSVHCSSPLWDGVTFRMFVCRVLCGE